MLLKMIINLKPNRARLAPLENDQNFQHENTISNTKCALSLNLIHHRNAAVKRHNNYNSTPSIEILLAKPRKMSFIKSTKSCIEAMSRCR
jgi:hypothetical protein